MAERRWRIAGVNFDHFHMGDLLRMAHDHPQCEIVGLSDEQPERMTAARDNFGLSSKRIFPDYRACLDQTKPDVVILCPATGGHAEWTERVAPFGAAILMEKPYAASVAEADRMEAAARAAGITLAINWPMRWYRAHTLAYQLAVLERRIGLITEIHYYDGNRGPLYHGADKIVLEPTPERKAASWFYSAEAGGGSQLDYMGYGTTLGTWYLEGRKPIEVNCMTWATPGLEVDEHSITVARYESGLSKFETRWGTFTDPWTLQPQPKCGFVLKGTEGTLSCYDAEPHVRMQTRDCPEGEIIVAPALPENESNPIRFFIDRLESGREIDGPLSLSLSRIGQQIVDTARLSAREKKTVLLVGE
jgi:predicted dehydrogenase